MARPNTEEFQKTKLYAGGLPGWWSDIDLHRHFSGFGGIVSARLSRNKETGEL